MQSSRGARILLAAGAVALAGLTACTSPAPAPAPSSSRTATTPPAPTPAFPGTLALDVTVNDLAVTTPATTLPNDNYVIHVLTTTATGTQAVQLAHPVGDLTRTEFLRRYARWQQTLRTHAQHPTQASAAAVTASAAFWRQSVTFLGGATAAGPTDDPVTIPATGYFAAQLAPGRYWLYAATNGQPSSANPDDITELTMTGSSTPPQLPPNSTSATFTGDDHDYAVEIPDTIPAQGYIYGVGAPLLVSTMAFHRLLPGVVDAEPCLDADRASEGNVCFPSTDSVLVLDGGVSSGAAALWYYELPPGRYAVTNAAPDLFGLYLASEGGAAVSYTTVR